MKKDQMDEEEKKLVWVVVIGYVKGVPEGIERV